MKKNIYITLTSCVTFFAIFVTGFLTWHHNGLLPELLFELPSEDCKDLPHRDKYITLVGEEVDSVCRLQGFEKGLFFALEGLNARRFIPREFHSQFGYMEIFPADTNTVYFYRYRGRYEPLVTLCRPISFM